MRGGVPIERVPAHRFGLERSDLALALACHSIVSIDTYWFMFLHGLGPRPTGEPSIFFLGKVRLEKVSRGVIVIIMT